MRFCKIRFYRVFSTFSIQGSFPTIQCWHFTKASRSIFFGPIYFSSHPPDVLDAIFGLTYESFHFQSRWQELLPVYDPKRSQTHVFGLNPPRVNGGVGFLYFLKLTFGPLGPFEAPPGSTFGPLGPLRALLVLHLDPWGP